eukprot:m.338550 g.338550  ORF g.338550 m.338550 type:complete len:267 (-) comp18459_c0_seq1:105-905(-)
MAARLRTGIAEQIKWGPVKFLGKLYVDRHRGKPLDEVLLRQAVGIIKKQAPAKNKQKIVFATSPKTVRPDGSQMAACLVSTDQQGQEVIKSAILNILSIGRIGSIIYYTTAGMENERHTRYWVRAFSCKSPEHAQFLCMHIMDICAAEQDGWQAAHAGSQVSLASAISRAGSGHSITTGITSLSNHSIQEHHQRRVPHLPPKSVSQHKLQVNQRPPLQNVNTARPQREPKHGIKMKKIGRENQQKPTMNQRQMSMNLDDYLQIIDI